MKNCFGYVRVSTVKQGDGVSLEAQREAIEAFAAQHNINITKWFEEKETAAKKGRPLFNAMVRDLKRSKAAGVVMHKIDRSARNFADWAKIGDLADAGIDVHFANESLDFRSRGGRLAADIQAVIAADYIRNLREETIKGISGRLKQGLYPFKAPMGYVDNGKGKPKTIDPVRGPLVREAFELYASGQHSLLSLLSELERRGLRNENGRPISKGCLENILNNPFYYGIIRIKRTGATYKGIHEALIAPSLFHQIQEIKAGKSSKKVTRHNHRYRGLFRCRECNGAITPERQKGHVYYRCHTPECPTTTVREERIEEAILSFLCRVSLSEEDVKRLTEELTKWIEKRNKNDETQTIAAQLALLEQRLERITDAVIDRVIDQRAFNSRKEAILLEQARLEERQQKAEAKRVSPHRIQRFFELIENLAQTYILATPEEKRQIVQVATSNRQVSGKNVYLEPPDWLAQATRAIAVLAGPPDRTTSRSNLHLREHHMEKLLDIITSDDVPKNFTAKE